MTVPIKIREPLAEIAAEYRKFVAGDRAARMEALGAAAAAAVKLAAATVEGLDADNRAAELPLLKAEVETLVGELAGELGAGLMVRAAIRYGVGPAIEAVADYGEAVSVSLRERVLPEIVKFEAAVASLRGAIEAAC